MTAVGDAEQRRLTQWAAGQGSAPWWIEPLLMAETWRLSPWEIVEHAPTEWVDRWRALQITRQEQQAVTSGQAKVVDGRVYRKVK